MFTSTYVLLTLVIKTYICAPVTLLVQMEPLSESHQNNK